MYAHVICVCSNEFQDKRYGSHTRVATVTSKARAPERAVVRCTVCGKEHDIPKSQVKGSK